MTTGLGNETVGNGPFALAYDAFNDKVYLIFVSERKVSIIDPDTHGVVDNIALNFAPARIAVDDFHKVLYLTSISSNGVFNVDLSQAEPTVRRISDTNNWPSQITHFFNSDRIFYSSTRADQNRPNNPYSIIEIGSGLQERLREYQIKFRPFDITSDRNGVLYVSLPDANRVAVMDLDIQTGGVEYLDVGSRPLGIDYSSEKDRVYVANAGSIQLQSLIQLRRLYPGPLVLGILRTTSSITSGIIFCTLLIPALTIAMLSPDSYLGPIRYSTSIHTNLSFTYEA